MIEPRPHPRAGSGFGALVLVSLVLIGPQALAAETRPTAASPLPLKSGQLVLVLTSDWDSITGVAQLFERRDGSFKAVGSAFPVVVGESGLAWGLGLHDEAGLEGPRKQEGDGKGVAGVFGFGQAMGYARKAPGSTRLSYLRSGRGTRCVDDSTSTLYNKIVEQEARARSPWSSAEQMRRPDNLYKWLVTIQHNSAVPVQAKHGSCIFFHLWRAADRGTAGCTAASEDKVLELMAFLDPARQPVLVQLPRSQYQLLRESWGLPALAR